MRPEAAHRPWTRSPYGGMCTVRLLGLRLPGDQMKTLKHIWSAFNRWRKRHWLLRLIILCLLAVNAVPGASLLPMLVRIACDAILADSEPKMLDAIYRSNRANATRRLRAALTTKLDTDEDGVLSDAEQESAQNIGLDPIQLTLPPLRVELEQLIPAAQRAGQVPLSYTPRALKKEAWRAALVETEEIMGPERRQLEAMLAWWRRPNYGSLSTWRTALAAFYEYVVLWGPYGLLGNPFHWIPFFAMTYLAALIAALLLRGRRAAAAILTAVIISGGINGLWAAVLPHSIRIRDYWSGPFPINSLCITGDSLLILAAAIAGARRGARYSDRARPLHVSMLLLGAILLAWGILPTPGYGLRRGFWYRCPFLLNGEIFGSMKAWICATGIAVVVAAVVLAVRHPCRRPGKAVAV